MEKTYQYVGEFVPCTYPGGIVFDPTYTTEDEVEQKFIEDSSYFDMGRVVLVSSAEKNYPKPEIEVSFKHSRSDLFENENIAAIKIPRLKAAAAMIGIEDVKSMRRPALVKAIMARTTK